MAKPNRLDADGKEDVLRALAQALVPYLRQTLGSSDSGEPEYYHQNNSPLGRRRHLSLVRQGVLRGRKVGKRVLVARRDMATFLEEHPSAAVDPTAPPDPLDDWGLTRRKR
jgi:hypothetical protein